MANNYRYYTIEYQFINGRLLPYGKKIYNLGYMQQGDSYTNVLRVKIPDEYSSSVGSVLVNIQRPDKTKVANGLYLKYNAVNGYYERKLERWFTEMSGQYDLDVSVVQATAIDSGEDDDLGNPIMVSPLDMAGRVTYYVNESSYAEVGEELLPAVEDEFRTAIASIDASKINKDGTNSDIGSLSFQTDIEQTVAEGEIGYDDTDNEFHFGKVDGGVDKFSDKVDKVAGKGLSTNDLTNTLKTAYDGAVAHASSEHAPSDAEKNVQSDWNQTDTMADDYIKNKPAVEETSNKVTAWGTPDDIKYPTTKLVDDRFDAVEASASALWNANLVKSVAISGNDLFVITYCDGSTSNILTLAQLKSLIGEATTSLNGLMSIDDKTHLDTLVALLESDEDTVINTIAEILAIFEDYPEGYDIATELATKVDKVEGKELSTNDYTDLEQAKLGTIEENAEVNIIEVVKDSAGTPLEVASADRSVILSKASVGLGNVDNTSDVNKPVSTAQGVALDTKLGLDFSALNAMGAIDTANDLVAIRDVSGTAETKKVAVKTLVESAGVMKDISQLGDATIDDTDYMLVGESGTPKKTTIGALKNHLKTPVSIEETHTERIESTYGSFVPHTNGIPMVKEIQGLTVDSEQLVTNGDFSDGATWWTASGSVLSEVADNLIVTGSGSNSSSSVFQDSLVVGQKYYIKAYVRVTNSLCQSITVRTTGAIIIQNTPTINVWYDLSIVNVSDNARLQLRATYDNTTDATNAVMEVDYVYAFNISTLITNKQYSPLYSTTFDLMSDEQIKAQMDSWVQDGTLPHAVQSLTNATIKSVGKNLFDGVFTTENVGLEYNSLASNSFSITSVIPVGLRTINLFPNLNFKPNTQYTFSGTAFEDIDKNLRLQIEYTDDTTDYILIPAFVETSFTRTSALGKTISHIGFDYSSLGSTTTFNNFQVELGTTATAYEPYVSETQVFNATIRSATDNGTIRDKIRYDNGKYVVDRYVDASTGLALATPLLANETVDVDGTLIQDSVTTLIQEQDLATVYNVEWSMNAEQSVVTLVQRDKLQQEEIDDLETKMATAQGDIVTLDGEAVKTVQIGDNTAMTPIANKITIPLAVPTGEGQADGILTHEDKAKLDGIAPGAQVNVLEGVQVNGVDLAVTDKTVNVIVPTQASDINAVPDTRTIANLVLSSDITLAQLKNAIGEATTLANGLLSKNDKAHLDTLVALLESDEDTVINTIAEILAIFEDYPEGYDIATELAKKVDKVDGYGLSQNDFTDALKTAYDGAVAHASSEHAPSTAQANVIESISYNGTPLAITEKNVNIPKETINISSIDTVYADIASLPSGKGNGTVLPAFDGGALKIFQYNGTAEEWEEFDTIRPHTIYVAVNTNKIYRYTMASPYFIELSSTNAEVNIIEVIKDSAGTPLEVASADRSVTLSKASVGLSNVDNTSDVNKPVSTAQQNALNTKVDKVEGETLTPNKYTDGEKAILNYIGSTVEQELVVIDADDIKSLDTTSGDETSTLTVGNSMNSVEIGDDDNIYVYNTIIGTPNEYKVKKLNRNYEEQFTISLGEYGINAMRIFGGHVYIAYTVSSSSHIIKRYSIVDGAEDATYTHSTHLIGVSDTAIVKKIMFDKEGNLFYTCSGSGSTPTTLVKLDPSGKEVLRVRNGMGSSGLAIDSEGNAIYSAGVFGTSYKKVFKVNGKTGASIWTSADLGGSSDEIEVDSNNDIILSSRFMETAFVKKLSKVDGSVLWTASGFSNYTNKVTIDADDNVYTRDGYDVIKLSKTDGAELWSVTLLGEVRDIAILTMSAYKKLDYIDATKDMVKPISIATSQVLEKVGMELPTDFKLYPYTFYYQTLTANYEVASLEEYENIYLRKWHFGVANASVAYSVSFVPTIKWEIALPTFAINTIYEFEIIKVGTIYIGKWHSYA